MNVLDIFFPKRCPVCLRALPFGNKLICDPCRSKIRYVEEPTCLKCGKPIADLTREYCLDCAEEMPPYERGIAYAEYSSFYMRRMLSEVKYRENAAVLDFPCSDFAARKGKEIRSFGAEVLIPVPIHKKKRKIRGYNQATEIANRIGKSLSIPVDDMFLFRTENTGAQKERSKEERAKNLQNAFSVCSEKTYEKVLLVDDIYTTGATVSCCAETLKEAGVKEVYVLVLAIGREN